MNDIVIDIQGINFRDERFHDPMNERGRPFVEVRFAGKKKVSPHRSCQGIFKFRLPFVLANPEFPIIIDMRLPRDMSGGCTSTGCCSKRVSRLQVPLRDLFVSGSGTKAEDTHASNPNYTNPLPMTTKNGELVGHLVGSARINHVTPHF